MPSEFKSGEKVPVPCYVSTGAFLNEYLITIDTAQGSISGFIDVEEVERKEGNSFVYGIVHEVHQDGRIILRLPGSFFTTTGIAHFSRELLETRP